jgi:hypothetical protein
MPSNEIISGIVLEKREEVESSPSSIKGNLIVETILAVVNIFSFVLGITDWVTPNHKIWSSSENI